MTFITWPIWIWVDLGYPTVHRPGFELAIFRSSPTPYHFESTHRYRPTGIYRGTAIYFKNLQSAGVLHYFLVRAIQCSSLWHVLFFFTFLCVSCWIIRSVPRHTYQLTLDRSHTHTTHVAAHTRTTALPRTTTSVYARRRSWQCSYPR